MSQQVRTRYAPSPTGFQHIGGIRTALYCYLFTRKMGGQFILRIEDTDRKRFVPGAEEYIVESLNWCGITCDEGTHVGGDYGPYRQSERKPLYQKYVQQLLESGHAYYAFDTSEELTAQRKAAEAQKTAFKYDATTRMGMKNSLSLPDDEVKALLDGGTPYVVRVKIPADETVIVQDMVRGEVTVSSNEMDDKIMMKADGMPTYHLANVVDDHLMKITHVIRGEEWLPSTPLHVVLYRFFGWSDTMPQFAHLPLILKPKGNGKLSKRDGDKFGFPVFPLAWVHPSKPESSTGYREIGFMPEAFINMLVFFGWNPGTEQEMFSMDELIETFSIERIGKSGARFNWEKAQWFNQQYLKMTDDATLVKMLLANAPEAYQNANESLVTKVVGMLKERMTLLQDFWTQASYFFALPTEYDRKVVRKKWKEGRRAQFEDLQNQLSALEDFSSEAIETCIKAFMAENNLGFGDVLQPFRVMLSGSPKGPSIFDITALLGKKEVIHRMKTAADAFDVMKAG